LATFNTTVSSQIWEHPRLTTRPHLFAKASRDLTSQSHKRFRADRLAHPPALILRGLH